MKKGIIIKLSMMLLLASSAFAQEKRNTIEVSYNLDLGVDLLAFFQSASYDGQKQLYPSIFAKPKMIIELSSNSSINFEGFARWDINGESRTHWDVRELYYQYYQGNWEFNAGVKKVYWGKTEGVHLVDVINQVDFLEGIDGEEKLGQPMLQLSYASKYGTVTGFAMPYSRQIAFGNEAMRPRTPEVISDEQVSFESVHDNWQPTFAIRWEHFIGDSDIGGHYFYGTAREPLVQFYSEGKFGLLYPTVNQFGLDYQLILNSAIFKLESIYRGGDFDDIFAVTVGIEYTFSNANGNGLDIGVLTEYVYDNRRELTFSSLDNDIFLASRLAFNNVQGTEILFGVFQDLSKSTKIIRLEGTQRIGNDFKITATGQGFFVVDKDELAYLFKRDSFFELELIKYF